MSAPVQIDGPHRSRRRARLLRALAWALSTLGTVLAMLGAFASANLMFATLAATITVGVLMFAGGVFQLVHAFGVRRQGRTWWWALSGLLYVGAALVTLADPLFAAGVLTLLRRKRSTYRESLANVA